MSDEDFYRFSPDMFKDVVWEQAVEDYPVGSWVYLEVTRQLGVVEEVRPNMGGPLVKVKHIGAVPLDELRVATKEEVEAYLNR